MMNRTVQIGAHYAASNRRATQSKKRRPTRKASYLATSKRVLRIVGGGRHSGTVKFAAGFLRVDELENGHVGAKSDEDWLFLEVERCQELTTVWKPSVCPLIIIKYNNLEVGRTPALKANASPVWHDECYNFPISIDTAGGGTLTLEAWGTRGEHYEIKDFLGKATLDLSALRCGGGSLQEIESELSFELNSPTEVPGLQSDSTHGRFQSVRSSACAVGTSGQVKGNKVKRWRRSSEPLVSTWVAARRGTKITPEMPANPPPPEKYRVSNPEPYRRWDGEETADESHGFWLTSSTMSRALALISAYLCFGVIGYSFVFESWPVRDSLYFSVVTFTTVGYGDIFPRSDGGKLFSCVFALSGIGIIGIALGYIGQNLVQAQIMALQTAQRRASRRDSRMNADEPESNNESTSVQPRPQTVPARPWQIVLRVMVPLFPVLAMIALGSVVVGTSEGWNWIDSVYWCIITGTSVGYGDFAPRSEEMRWFSIVFIPLSVGVISTVLGRVANVFVEREIAKSNSKLLESELTLEDLEDMNVDGDGEVSLIEFVEFMLKSMHKVDQPILDKLHRQFERLDADGSGSLQKKDLEILTQRKREDSRAMALQRYKDDVLLRQS